MEYSNNNEKPNNHAISQVCLFFFLFVLAICPVLGQGGQTTKIVKPEDYAMWHKLVAPDISGDGKWTSMRLSYKNANDTIYVMDTKGKKQYKLPNSKSGRFSPGKETTTFAFHHDSKGVGILNLFSGAIKWVRAQRMEFSMDGRFLVCYTPSQEDGFLQLLDIKTNKTSIFQGVQHFSFSPLGDSAVMVKSDSLEARVELLKLEGPMSSTIVRTNSSEYLKPIWNWQGNGVAFIESTKNKKQRLYYFENGKNPILKEFDGMDLPLPNNFEIGNKSPFFSNDGKRIFFNTNEIGKDIVKKIEDTVKVQVWRGDDKLVYSRKQNDYSYQDLELLSVWFPHSGKVTPIGDLQMPKYILTGDQKYALTYNLLSNEPQYRKLPQFDFFLKDLETGESKVFMDDLELEEISMSPNGKFIAYFKDNHWWIYTIETNVHEKVTSKIPFPLNNKYLKDTDIVNPYGKMGWTETNDLLVYDEYDIWKVSPIALSPECLTPGRLTKTVYREYKLLNMWEYPLGFKSIFKGHDLSKEIILNITDSVFNHGFVKRKPNGQIDPFLIGTARISELRKAKFNDSYVFLEESYNSPPKMEFLKGKKRDTLFRSNPHHKKFAFGRTEIIPFKNNVGMDLHGLLHYPDNYDPGKKYPMIVHVYEMVADRFHYYVNPDMYREDGFNYRNFTSNGYFVLEPDIFIQVGNPGVSATDCVVTSVNKVLESNKIRENAIGLIGHSFGGYETAFIITQTNLFSAAVVGAGLFDMISSYHSITEDSGKTEFHLYEYRQYKMGKSYYEDREAYKSNSPMEFAHNINTPTLIWTGNEDTHVDWHQSQAMYLALRRRKLNVELLLYEKEAHSLLKPKNQIDLTLRIQDWFDKYLNVK